MSGMASLPGDDRKTSTGAGGARAPDLRLDPPDQYLKRIGALADDAIDLGHAALALSALDHPDRPLAEGLVHLEALRTSAAAATTSSASVDMQATALLDLMTATFGYAGDSETYEDMRNADLMTVIDRRRGLPVALGILYMHAVQGYGGHVVGLAFPAHFCIRLESRGQRLIIDPFDAVVLSARDLRERLKDRMHRDAEIIPAYHQPVAARDILLRLQNNIRFRALRSGNLDRAREIIERMMLIAPARADLRRELALIHARRGDIGAAVAVLEDFLSAQPSHPGSANEVEDLLRKLRDAKPG